MVAVIRMFRPAGPVSIAFFLLVQSLVMCQGIINGPQSTGNECCQLHLMDSASQRVAIETSSSLLPATYSAVRLRVCSTDPVLVQLWRYINDVTYEFRWQLQFSPSPTQTSLTYVTIPLSSNITTTTTDRLGFYSVGMQLIVPFSANSTSSVRLSNGTISDPAQLFADGQTVTVDSYVWPRTFQRYVTFCTAPDCSDQPTPTTSVGSSPSDTVVSAPSSQCCAATVSCDPSPDVTNGLNSQSNDFNAMKNKMNELSKKLNTLVSQNTVTGLCPQGFLSGSYSLGSCYMMVQQRVPCATALSHCRQYGASLLTIESELENEFLRAFVGNNTVTGQSSVVQFWTQGMYSFYPTARGWYWLEGQSVEQTITQIDSPILFSHWQNGTMPIPDVVTNNICLVLNVDRSQNTAYWVNEDCADNNFYFCEISKQCL